jgi:two-component system KDP operon response regulator KdpE
MATGARILVIDDEPQIHRFLAPALEANGYEVIKALTGGEGLAAIARRAPDAVILDLGLPDMDGQLVLAKARETYEGPIIILSARDKDVEKIEALDHGADDYVEKPFSVGELLARLRAAIRNKLGRQGGSAVVKTGELEIDLIKRMVLRHGEAVKLSPREYDLLSELVKGAGLVLTQKQLLAKIWGPANVDDIQYLRTYMAHLRQKLEPDPASPRHLITEAGVGYRFISELPMLPSP